jgi:DTW domain-containing protein YfiP
MCTRCERPVSVCYCAALTTIETRSRIVILQHPREQGMPIGTAHMAHLCLPQSSVHVGIKWDGTDVLRRACADPERPPVLLYPGKGARDILQDPPVAPVTLIVIDGTWSQARTLVRNSPELADVPQYAFNPPAPSNYRIRREPRDEYVSTIEALMHVLGAIEGDAQRFRPLLRPMNAMVDAQIKARAANRHPRTKPSRPRPTPYERLPSEIRDRYEDLVLVFGDANAWPHGTDERRYGDELVYWVAHRPSAGETFSFVVAPRNPVAPDIPRHTGLPVEELLAGGTVAAMLAAFSAFLRPTDVIGSWGHHGLRMFKDCGGTLPGPFLDLQQVARSLTNAKAGSIERFADDLPATAVPGLPPGRAGRRLGRLLAVLDAWRALSLP